mgnify:CR=1 FL=1
MWYFVGTTPSGLGTGVPALKENLFLLKFETAPQNGAILMREQKGIIILELLNLIIFPGRYPPDPIQSSFFLKCGTIPRLGTLWVIF